MFQDNERNHRLNTMNDRFNVMNDRFNALNDCYKTMNDSYKITNGAIVYKKGMERNDRLNTTEWNGTIVLTQRNGTKWKSNGK